jgi:DNA topoisomerase VI subunit B
MRETFTTSRALEFLSENELAKKIGYSRNYFHAAVLKELIDNALDHCEEIGRLPEIVVEITDTGLIVRDNGDGIPPEVVKAMLDFGTRTSSREAYRCPTRGAQGNAGKCLIAVPYVLAGSNGKAIITAQGVRHEVAVGMDSLAQKERIEYEATNEKVQIGTSVEIVTGELGSRVRESFCTICNCYAALNPHLTISLDGQTWERTANECPKWSAANPDPPAWHDIESFERLAGRCISKDRESGEDRPLREFVKEFAGLTRSSALKSVADETGLKRACLSSLACHDKFDREKTKCLLASMRKHGKQPKPEQLGMIGREHITRVFGEDTKYKRISGVDDRGLPFVVEAAFSEDDGPRLTGCNFSPAIHGTIVRSLDWLLPEQRICLEDSAVSFLLHFSTVNPTYTDHGKTVVEPSAELRVAIDKCVKSVTDEYAARQRRAEREISEGYKQYQQLKKEERLAKTPLNLAVYAVMLDAIQKASGGGRCEFSNRDLYYAARELVQAYTSAELKQGYFDKIVDKWEEEYGIIEGRLLDARGYLLEPHTGKKIELGTKAVSEYRIPLHLYETILYVEKKGLLTKFELGRIAERYDCAIMASEGYAVRAAKALIDAAQEGHKMKVLCFHDADPDGYSIARTLSKNTGAHHFNIEIIDAGMSVQEALDMGLETEYFPRKKRIHVPMGEVERKYWTGEKQQVVTKNGKYKTIYTKCQRIELNALSADPMAFLQWIEDKLNHFGVAKKLIPPAETIQERAEDTLETELYATIREQIEQELDLDGLTLKAAESLKIEAPNLDLKQWAKNTPPEHWTHYIDRTTRGAIDDHHHEIIEQVRKAIGR